MAFAVGTTTVTYTATDARNLVTASFTVAVTDNEAGHPWQPGDLGTNDAGAAVLNWTAPTAMDNCSIDTFMDHSEAFFQYDGGCDHGHPQQLVRIFPMTVTDDQTNPLPMCPPTSPRRQRCVAQPSGRHDSERQLRS